MPDTSYVVVIGGANMDIAGRSDAPLVPGDSNPGTVHLSPGGVGRNVAHNLALLGVDVRLITAFGEDPLADLLRASCREVGIDTTASLTVPCATTSTYLYLMDETGEMRAAINDMAILGALTKECLAERMGLIEHAAVVVADANLPADTLTWLSSHVGVPLFCDPISIAKSPRLVASLGRIHTLKPNLKEAQALSGVRIGDATSLERAARRLLATGLRRAFVSLGARGLLCAEGTQAVRLPPYPCKVASTTGAGDAMLAGLIWAQLHGLGLADSGKVGLAAAAIASESNETVSPAMSSSELARRMGDEGPRKVWQHLNNPAKAANRRGQPPLVGRP